MADDTEQDSPAGRQDYRVVTGQLFVEEEEQSAIEIAHDPGSLS